MKRYKLAALAATFAVAAASCGSGSTTGNASDTSGGEGTSGSVATGEEVPADLEDELVVLCTVAEEWCTAATEAYAEKTGVATDFVRLSSGEATTRLEAEGDDPSFDVWYGGPSTGAATAAKSGLIEPYLSDNASVIADEYKSPETEWTGIYVGALGFCSNPEILEDLGLDAPTSWDDLLDEKYASNIAIADQRTSGTAITAGANLVALKGSEDAALEYMKALHPNISDYTRSGSAPGRMAAAGEIATAVIFSHDCVNFAKETGVDLEVSFPAEGTGYEVGQVSLIANAKNPNAAKAFIDWSLTAEAQEIGAANDQFQIPTNADATVPEEAVSLDDIVLAEEYTPRKAEELDASDFKERFAEEVRDGVEEPPEK